MVDGEAGKGDRYRALDMDKWRKNWDRIFGDKNAIKGTKRNRSRKSTNRRRK